MAEEEGRVTGVWHISKLREMIQRWQQAAILSPKEGSPQPIPSGIPPAVDQRVKAACAACDSDEENSSQGGEAPPDVPKGYLAVYVGPEHRRFVIPTVYLRLPVFKVLLEKAEEEFGFHHKGGLTFPCEIETFKYILQCMEQHQKGLIDDDGNPTDVEE